MDGAKLRAEASRRHPETAPRLACACHQYLPKLGPIEVVRKTIERTLPLRDMLMSETLQRLVARIHSLPSRPTVCPQLIKELEKGDPGLNRIGPMISHDPGMSAQMLHLVDSACFGLTREVSHPSEATMFPGVDLIHGRVGHLPGPG